jgi:hypothetical protein
MLTLFINPDGIVQMLQLQVIGISGLFLLFISAAIFAVVKLTERENKKG